MTDIRVIPDPLCPDCGDFTPHHLLDDGYECSVCHAFQSKPAGRACPDCFGMGELAVIAEGVGHWRSDLVTCASCDGSGRIGATPMTTDHLALALGEVPPSQEEQS